MCTVKLLNGFYVVDSVLYKTLLMVFSETEMTLSFKRFSQDSEVKDFFLFKILFKV